LLELADVSTATTTLIAAAVGLLAAIVGGLLTGGQQRSSQLRDRMLDISLDYVQALRDAAGDAPTMPRAPTTAATDAMARAFRLSQAAVLIFGPDSTAGERAMDAYSETLAEFQHAQEPLEVDARIRDDADAVGAIWLNDHEHIEASTERAQREFAREAGRAIRHGGQWSWRAEAKSVSQRLHDRRLRGEWAPRLREAQASRREAVDEMGARRDEYRKMLDAATPDDDDIHVGTESGGGRDGERARASDPEAGTGE
jgi:hypothetical protein